MIRLLERAAAWLAHETPAFITAVAVFTFFVPSAFGWVRGDVQTAILGVIMLTMGMTLTRADFRILAARPLDIAIGTLAQFSLMPLIAWSLVHVLGLPRGIAVGLVLVGTCPGGVSSNIMSFLCKGDVAFSVGMTTLSTLLAPFATPFLMLHLAGETVDVDALGMFPAERVRLVQEALKRIRQPLVLLDRHGHQRAVAVLREEDRSLLHVGLDARIVVPEI